VGFRADPNYRRRDSIPTRQGTCHQTYGQRDALGENRKLESNKEILGFADQIILSKLNLLPRSLNDRI
jgi:hypothetical protein